MFNLFTKDKMSVSVKLVKKASKLFLGKVADTIWESAKRHVAAVEKLDKTGPEKFVAVYEGVKSEIGEPRDAAKFWTKILIETLVMVLKKDASKFFRI